MDNPELRAFYDRFVDEASLQELVRDREQENIHLEFKKKKRANTPELDQSDSWQFSRALSGLANSDGGVLFWGIGTDGEERASDLVPISGYRDFQARLKKSLLDAVQPMVDGVSIEAIPSLKHPDAGFVKCLIPSSDKSPHRGMLADREYYKRSTEGFYRLEHFDLEDMFGRRPIPRLELTTTLVQRGSSGGGGQTEYKGLAVVAITNVGRGSARAPFLAIEVDNKYNLARGGLDGNGGQGLPRRATANDRRTVFTSSEVVIHPGPALEVSAIDIYTWVNHKEVITIPPDLVIRYELAAENARTQYGEITFVGKEIARVVLPERMRGAI